MKVKSLNDLTGMKRKAVESFVYKVAVEKLAILQLEDSDTRFKEKIAQRNKREIGWHALGGGNIRITS